MKNKRIVFESTLNGNRRDEQGAMAIKRGIGRELEAIMKKQNMSKSELIRRMNISRAQLYRLLDPANENIQVKMLVKATSTIDRKLRIELV